MAEPARKDELLSSMRFSESPFPTSAGYLNDTAVGQPLLPENATDQPLGAWPKDDVQGRYDATAETVGNALGTVVHTAKKIPNFMQDRAEYLRKRFRVIRGRAMSGDLEKDVREQASVLADETTRELQEARSRAEYYAHNCPLQFIAGTAAAGFAVGFLLGLWRDR